MSLKTNYLGLRLDHPLMPGASPLVDDLGIVRKLEDAGASAIVMHSLFEEQISGQRFADQYHLEMYADAYAEALSYFPSHEDYALGKEEYLEHIGRLKKAVAIPVIASLNGNTPGGWIEYAKLIEDAGADALELNLYTIAADTGRTGFAIEEDAVTLTREVCSRVRIPVAVKLSPYYTSLADLCAQLVAAGAKGLVLFNRFYQPDIDLEALETKPILHLSDSSELLLRLRWAAILSPQIDANIALSGGVHTPADAVKALMSGATTVQVVSALLKHGPSYLSKLISGLKDWMEVNEYTSLAQLRGSMALHRCPDPRAYERANYMKVIQSWSLPK